MEKIRSVEELKKLTAKTFKQEMQDLQTLKRRTDKKIWTRNQSIMTILVLNISSKIKVLEVSPLWFVK